MSEPLPTVANLLSAMRGYLALRSPEHVLFSLAVAVASRFDGDPLWGLLVGAPSSGKTETLRALDDVADEHLDELTVAGLLSWSRGKNPKARGLLARHPEGALFATVADLSTLLAMSDKGTRDMLYSLLRRAYDGQVSRDIDGPEQLAWRGRLTLLAAVTPSVDSYSSHADALGPRWLYFRLPEADPTQRRAASAAARESGLSLADHRRRVRILAGAIVAEAVRRSSTVTVSDLLGEQLDDAALVACVGRGVVPREGYGRREILGLPTIEEPPRIASQLDKLARALLALGLGEKDAATLCRRAALDSMPRERLACLDVLVQGELLSQAEVARRASCDRSVARRTLEDLAALGLARCQEDEDERRGPWALWGDYAQLVHTVAGAPRAVAKSVYLPPHPPRSTGGKHTSRNTPQDVTREVGA